MGSDGIRPGGGISRRTGCMAEGMVLLILVLTGAVTLAQSPPEPVPTAHASVTVSGHILNGAFTFDRVGDLTMWGPGGGLIDIDSEKGGTFQYSPLAKPGKFKTTPATPLVVQIGTGPAVKIVTSAAGECTVTVTRADDTGVAGSFECGAVTVTGPEKKIFGPIDSMTGSFTASR
jgi:hypothetical protein